MQRTSSKKSTDSARLLLRRKLHPHRHPNMSGLMAAIVGFVIDAPFGNPPISEMTVSDEGMILARPKGEVSVLPVGRYLDLLPSWFALLNAASLTPRERIEAELLFAAKIGYYGRPTA
jgi:hypothetical protein